MPAAKRVRYTVTPSTGPMHFPIDMLRYDCSWPASSEDAAKIQDNAEKRAPRGVEITLSTHMGEPEKGRWQSFGWTVVRTGRY
jgi:hypothetical protein